MSNNNRNKKTELLKNLKPGDEFKSSDPIKEGMMMEEMMKNGNPFANMVIDNCMPSPLSALPGGDFLSKLLTGNNRNHMADILNSLSSMLGNNSSKLRLTGMVDGAHIDIELSNMTTLNMALQVINKEIENAAV